MYWYIGLGLLLAGVLFWRLVLPNMKSAAPVSAGGAGAPTPGTVAKKVPAWIREYFWSILLVVAAVVVVAWGIFGGAGWASKKPTEVGEWASRVWLPILILWGIAAALIAIHATGAAAKALQEIMAVVVFAVVVAFPFWGWVTTPSAPKQNVSGNSEQVLVLEPYKGSMRMKASIGHYIRYSGKGFAVRCVYPGNNLEELPEDGRCRPDVDYEYATDRTGKVNRVGYEFVIY